MDLLQRYGRGRPVHKVIISNERIICLKFHEEPKKAGLIANYEKDTQLTSLISRISKIDRKE